MVDTTRWLMQQALDTSFSLSVSTVEDVKSKCVFSYTLKAKDSYMKQFWPMAILRDSEKTIVIPNKRVQCMELWGNH